MANRTMEELLQAPTERYGSAIVISEILAENFEIKTNLLQFKPTNSTDDLVNKFVNQFFPPSKTTHLKNEISRFTQRFDETFSEAWNCFKEFLRACPHHGFSELTQIDTFYNGLTEQDQDSLNAASGGNLLNKTTREALQIIENKSKVRYSRNKSNVSRVNTNSRDVVSKTDDRIDKLADQISNLVEIVNKQVIAPAKVVEKTCVTCGGAHAYYECIATDIQEVLLKSNLQLCQLILELDVPRTQSKPSIPYPSSFADALLLMPKFASTIKSLLANKDKLFELAKVLLNENFSAMLLQKLPEKLGDQGKFLITCDFLRMNVCHALADLRTSINLKPLSIWKKLSLPELTPTRMTLELADRSITRPKGVAEDIFVKVGKFHFPTDFIVVDFEADLRVPLILGRSFLRTGHALIDVYREEITLRVNNESITFNLDQVMRYSDNSLSRVNVINIASEKVVHDNTKSSNPTLVSKSDFCEDAIVKTSPFRESDFFSEEIENFLKDDSIPMEIENYVFDPQGGILLIEKLFNEEPCQLHPMNLNHAKSPIEEPEYSFSMGYEHFITTPVTKLYEVAESSDKNLVPILREHEVTSYDENFKNDDSEEGIYVLEGLRVDNFIPNSKNELSDNEASDFDNPSFARPPPEPPDDEFDFELNFGEVIPAVMSNIEDIYDKLECLDPGGEIDVSINNEDDDYFPFMFVI
nr:reverse transcriptase domain-containing protein [Tanacetum cinerariifolium]